MALESIGESKWNTLKEALVSTAKEVIPKKEKNVKKKWITNEILDLMKERQQILPRNRPFSYSAKEPGSSVIFIHFYTRDSIEWR